MFTMTFKTQEFDFPSLELFLGPKMKLENKLYTLKICIVGSSTVLLIWDSYCNKGKNK